MQSLFQWLLGAGRETALFIISMIPLIELRGAVPLGLAIGMRWTEALPICYLGNLVPIPFLLLFAKRLLKWMEKLPAFSRFSLWYQQKLLAKSDRVTRFEGLGLFIFVAIPLPGTGAWSGAVLATLLGLPPKRAFVYIACGVVTAGILMALLSSSVLSVIGLA